MREDVHRTPAGAAELRAAIAPWTHVRSIGEDVAATELLLPAGHRLRPFDLAAAAAAGVTDLVVRRAPRVAVVPTGDEIRPVGAPLAAGEIPDTNSLMLAGQARQLGAEVTVTPIVPDQPPLIAAAVHAAAAVSDLVIVLAGSSAGRDDWTAQVVADEGVLAVHGVAVRPGHPVVLGVVDATPVLGAPGFPVSAALTFDIFAAPLLAALEGTAPARRPTATARLARKLASPAAWTTGCGSGSAGSAAGWSRRRCRAAPGVLTSLVRADGLLLVPAGLEGHHAGEDVEVELLRGLDEVARTIVAIGSHDLVLDLAASALRERDPQLTLVSSNVGSLGGLVAVRDGLCHVAGSHLLDPATGEYTLPYLDRVLGPGEPARWSGWCTGSRGCWSRRATRSGWRGVEDLTRPGVRYVNRQRGAGHPGAARPRAGPARARPGGRRGLRPGGEHPPRGRAPRSRPAGPTPAWASWLPRAPSAWTSCPWPRSPTTWSPRAAILERRCPRPVARPDRRPRVRRVGRGARRLLHGRDRPADPVGRAA